MTEKCRFCDIAAKKVEDYIIWENDNLLALLDIRPAKQGHCMLIPKKHIDYLFELDHELYSELFMAVKKLSEPLKKATNAKRIGIIVFGFEVPHAHVHLIPLSGSNELIDVNKFTKAKPEELKEIQDKIKGEIAKFKI